MLRSRNKIFSLNDESIEQIKSLIAKDQDMTASSLIRDLVSAEFVRQQPTQQTTKK
jgi:hypothetical protein